MSLTEAVAVVVAVAEGRTVVHAEQALLSWLGAAPLHRHHKCMYPLRPTQLLLRRWELLTPWRVMPPLDR